MRSDEKAAAERAEILRSVRAVADSLGGTPLGIREYMRLSGVSQKRIYHAFDNWSALCHEAGVDPKRAVAPIPEDEIFAAMRDAFLEIGGVPGRIKFDRFFRYSPKVLHTRGWTWPQALFAFREWAEANAPDFPYMDGLPESLPPRRARMSRPRPPVVQPRSATAPPPAPRTWAPRPTAARGGEALGEMINFRGLVHAPVNEMGVVMLFGAVAEELGYAVEAVRPGFPDCEAKRRIGGGRWERVRIEFEYRSRAFRHHGHDPAGCDVIVCWRHDWTDCPLEVLELRTAIGGLCFARGVQPPHQP